MHFNRSLVFIALLTALSVVGCRSNPSCVGGSCPAPGSPYTAQSAGSAYANPNVQNNNQVVPPQSNYAAPPSSSYEGSGSR